MVTTDWITDYFDGLIPACDGRELRVDCPFCGDDRKAHLYISTVKPVAHCHRCGWSGTHALLVMDVSGAESLWEAWRLINRGPTLMEFKSIADRLQPKPTPAKDLSHMPDWFQPFSKGLDGLSSQMVLDYALKRLTAEELRRYGMGFCRDSKQPEFMRLVIPVERGYYQARSIFPGVAQKYINPKDPIEDRLFNYPALEAYNQVYIAEGIISAIALGESAVATLGKEPNTAQLSRLRSSPVARYTLAFDAGTEYGRGLVKAAEHLGVDKPVTIRQYSEGDPDSSESYIEFPYTLQYSIEAGFHTQRKPKRLTPPLGRLQDKLTELLSSS